MTADTLTQLMGAKLIVFCGDDRKQLTLVRLAGKGAKAYTWQARDAAGQLCAVKLVCASDYIDHSVEAEIERVNRLGRRFARIQSYGNPSFDSQSLNEKVVCHFAIVADWVEGTTLDDFCTNFDGVFDVRTFLEIARSLCEALALLSREGLCHNDMHGRNVMIAEVVSGPALEVEYDVIVIDSGSLTTVERRSQLLEEWGRILSTIEESGGDAMRAETLRQRIEWFSHTDQEWVVRHLCEFANLLRCNLDRLAGAERKFAEDLPEILLRMVDPDPSMRISNPLEMFQQLEALWKRHLTPPATALRTPFDFISAELIRHDNQLVGLFSAKCPWFGHCASADPIYIYGPRGCGKSTILRMLSLSALLQRENAEKEFSQQAYIGVYISCTSELRSRFLLFPKNKYDDIAGHVVLYFSMLLAESLLATLELLRDGNVEKSLGGSVGLTNDTSRQIAEKTLSRFGEIESTPKLRGVSWLTHAKKRIAWKRHQLWYEMLGNPSPVTPDPSKIFDVVADIEEVFPLLSQRKIAFLLDDYSNQRIPPELQSILNRTISFAKQGNPIFKVASEYLGLELDEITEGREVVEINLGAEYVALQGPDRSSFLEDIINIRFRNAGIAFTVEDLLGRSRLQPAVQMAREIRSNRAFHYYGIDTISDICSGDLAMALGLIRRIYEQNASPRATIPVPPKRQHDVISDYSEAEHRHLWYCTPLGKQMSLIADKLCWLAREAALKCTSMKDGTPEPMVKTHIDISVDVMRQLREHSPEAFTLLEELERRGVIFTLGTSRSRMQGNGTARYQVRRILLAKYVAPLGRRDPMKVDMLQRLLLLLTDPATFTLVELKAGGHDPKQTQLELGKDS